MNKYLILNSILIVIAALAIVCGFFVIDSIPRKLGLWGLSLGCLGAVFLNRKYRMIFAILGAILIVASFIMDMSNK